jgi:hypothetical protein
MSLCCDDGYPVGGLQAPEPLERLSFILQGYYNRHTAVSEPNQYLPLNLTNLLPRFNPASPMLGTASRMKQASSLPRRRILSGTVAFLHDQRRQSIPARNIRQVVLQIHGESSSSHSARIHIHTFLLLKSSKAQPYQPPMHRPLKLILFQR